MHLSSPIQSPVSVILPSPPPQQQPAPPPPSTPAFLSRFPRSLSSLSLGTKKKTADKENTTTTSSLSATTTPTQPPSTNTPLSSPSNIFQSELPSPQHPPFSSAAQQQSHMQQLQHHHHHHHHPQHPPPLLQQSSTPSKKKSSTTKEPIINKLASSPLAPDIPPPLPQRNIARKPSDGGNVTTSPISSCTTSGGIISTDIIGGDVNLRRNTQISDLDYSLNQMLPSSAASGNICKGHSSNSSPSSSSAGGKGKQRTKQQKIKALSDPKMSSQTFIDMEQALAANEKPPPPLPPRQPGMLEEKQNVINNNRCSNGRPLPNSLDSHLNYPLVATCTAVRDNLSAFPLSHRPNIVQQLQNSGQYCPNNAATGAACKSSVSNSSNSFSVYQHNTLPKKKQKSSKFN